MTVLTPFQAAWHGVRRLASFAKEEAAWAALALGDTPLPRGVQDLLVHGHQRFAGAPNDAPSQSCPRVVEGAASGPLPRAVGIDLAAGGEAALTLTAAAPGTDWGKAGAESAVVSIFVDGKYNQDVVLYGGATPTAYSLALGSLEAGHHTVTLAFNQAASSPGATSVMLKDARLEPASEGLQALAERCQPFFYGRDDNNRSDVPLMMWCEAKRQGEDTLLSYAVMHSNEDGGTGADPAAEQASWGRETDPDPICTVLVGPDGRIKETRYIGWLDEPGTFQGRYEGSHPILRVAAPNNSYDDRGTSKLLFRPRVQLRDFGAASRESLMDANPWTYRISNEELQREGKLLTPAEATAVLASGTRPRKAFDLRQYLYVDYTVANPNHSQLAVAVKLKGQDRWYASDFGDRSIDAMWSGQGLRTTVALPAGVKPGDVEAIRVIDRGGKPLTLASVNMAFLLDDAYQPQALKLASTPKTRLGAGQTLTIAVRAADGA